MKRLRNWIKEWIKKKEKTLPSKAHELLQLTLDSVAKCEREPYKYIVTHEYEFNMFHVYTPQFERTALNFAGALAAKTFNIDYRESKKITDFDNDTFDKLLSVHLLSNFEIYQGLELLYRGTDKLELCLIIGKCFKPENKLYEDDMVNYKKLYGVLTHLLRSLDL